MSMPARNGDWIVRTSAEDEAPQRTASRKASSRSGGSNPVGSGRATFSTTFAPGSSSQMTLISSPRPSSPPSASCRRGSPSAPASPRRSCSSWLYASPYARSPSSSHPGRRRRLRRGSGNEPHRCLRRLSVVACRKCGGLTPFGPRRWTQPAVVGAADITNRRSVTYTIVPDGPVAQHS